MVVEEVLSVEQRIAQFGRLMTADELGSFLGKSAQAILRLARREVIPSSKIGGSIRFDPQTVGEWVARSKVGGR